jgi:hypothetical protein
MPPQRLYLIGNGFDLYHKIPSRYSDFGQHLKQVNPDLHETLETYLSVRENWADFESDLADLDVDFIIDIASAFLVSYSAEDWSDAYHHDFQYEVENIVDALSRGLKAEFTAWATALEIPDVSLCPVPLLPLDTGARYLNFNYTSTLQRLYRISPELILHIHNSVADHQPDLVLGHAVNPSRQQSLNYGLDLESQDTRVTEANEILDSYFSSTYKPTHEVIKKHRGYFDSLAGINEICVVGHSLSKVDIPYFAEIINITSPADPEWVVTYYIESNVQEMKRALVGAGVPSHKVKFTDIFKLPT